MKRNKCTKKVAAQELNPLTERILAKMGLEGTAIRRRLRHLFKERHGQRGEVARWNPEGGERRPESEGPDTGPSLGLGRRKFRLSDEESRGWVS